MDLILVKRAKEYISKMANGINPLTGEQVKDDDMINNIKISRCFFFVYDILNEIIANDGSLKRSNNKKDKFYIDSNTLKRYRFIEGYAPISKIVASINELIDLNTMKKLKSTDITKWFISVGILKEGNIDEKKQKIPTELGLSMGIYTEFRQNEFKSYYIIMYPKKIQEFIIDNFDSLLGFINND